MSSKQRDEDISSAAGNEVRVLETGLLEQGIKLFPGTRDGQRADFLWRRIRKALLSGAGVQITVSALGLRWHRQELKRARDILLEMRLIYPTPDGLYGLDSYDSLDDLVREQFAELQTIEKVMSSLSKLMR